MNPLDANHHLRSDEWCEYREGCVLNRPVKAGKGSWVNIGINKDCKVDETLPEKTRVTVKLNEKGLSNAIKFYTGTVVSMSEPKENLGLYWGYSVRVVKNMKEVVENTIYNVFFNNLGTL